jgi:galactokinase
MQKPLLTFIKENWILIVVVAQFILNMGYINNALTQHEKRIIVLENTKEQNAIIISEINSRLASIETSLKFIEKTLR